MESSIKVTEKLGVSHSDQAFMASQSCPGKRLGDRKAILPVTASTTWTRGDLVSNDTMDKHLHQEFDFSHPPHYVSKSPTCNLCIFTFLV